ncbi:MAG: hypothetical protein ACYC0H_21655 [Solirubrobacteraceae bacterium]
MASTNAVPFLSMQTAAELMIVDLYRCQSNEDEPLASLEAHAWNLMSILEDPDLDGSWQSDGSGLWDEVADWLRFASGLREVVIDSARFDASVMTCKGADAFEAERSEQLTAVATDLTRIIYVWNAVERMRAAMEAPGNAGTAAALADLLSAYGQSRYVPSHYQCNIRALRAAVGEDPGLDEAARVLARADDDDPTAALRALAKVRNVLVHGVLRLPSAGVAGEAILRRVLVAKLTARAGLFSIQMLAHLHYESHGAHERTAWDRELALDAPVTDVLAKVHLNV